MFKTYLEYIKDNPRGLWFKRKLYGWGWTPAKWQGWAVIAIFLVAILAISFSLPKEPSDPQMVIFFVEIGVLVAGLIFICYKKGEKPKWQWGKPKV